MLTLPVRVSRNMFQDEMFVIQEAKAARNALYTVQAFVDFVLSSNRGLS
jgi:hypothetical protein